MSRIILFNKPYGVLSQFSGEPEDNTLADFINIRKVYPAGRLDKDSEGLLLLTDDGELQHKISHPNFDHHKRYWVQVEGQVSQQHCRQLCQGVTLKDGKASAVSCKIITEPDIWPRKPPIRQRRNITTSWLSLVLNEGRNRQVRRMTAAIELPTLRLIRSEIGPWQLANLQPGEHLLLQRSQQNFLNKLANVKPQ